MPLRRSALIISTLVLTCGSGSARHAGAQPAPPAGPASPAKPTTDPRAKATLEAARAAVSKLNSLAYTITTAGPGSAAAKGDVFIKKADAGGWKFFVRCGEGDAAPDARMAAYDGLNARALDDERKVVWDQSTEKIRAIRAVFAKRELDLGVPWELFGDENWVEPDIAPASDATIDGVPCEVIILKTRIERLLPPSAPGGPAAPSAPAPSAPAPAGTKPPPKPDLSTAHEVRLFLSKADHLPRRIIRKAEGGAGPVTVNISAIELDKAIPDSYFNLDTPSGYTVKAAIPSPTPKPDGARVDRKPPPDPAAPATFGLAIGSDAPAFTLKDAAGKDHALADYRGKVVILDFWGSWCPPCRAAMPGIQKLHERYKDKPVAVLGLNFEQSAKADPAKFMQEQGFTYGLLLKAETIARDYKIAGWPTFYILDREGRIAWSTMGYDPAHEEQMVKVIDDLLSK